MAEEFPNNSRAAAAKASSVPPEVDKQIEKIISGEATVRKPSGLKRFRSSFIAGDASSVGEHVFWNLAVPAARDALSETLSAIIHGMIYGERPSRGSGGTGAPATGPGSTSKMNYSSMSSGVALSPAASHDVPKRINPNEIYVRTHAEADAIIAKMFDVLERFKVVSLADLYMMIGHSPNQIDYKWGWKNLDSADVRRDRHGVRLVLPNPQDLN
jgi:hypothetical protein